MRLLVIEDEVKLAEYLRKGLTQSGYVHVVENMLMLEQDTLQAKAPPEE